MVELINPKRVFKGGIKSPHHKKTSEFETEVMPLPTKIIIPMLQHIGAPCTPNVKKGDYVFVGQKIGDSESFISAPVHSSVSGTVSDVRPVLYPNGGEVISIEIKPDGLQKIDESISPIKNLNNKEELLRKIRESGIVGLGGAGFPTAVKLSPPKGKIIDILIINGAECEPYITSDYREMMENAEGILEGTKIIMELTGIKMHLLESNQINLMQLKKLIT